MLEDSVPVEVDDVVEEVDDAVEEDVVDDPVEEEEDDDDPVEDDDDDSVEVDVTPIGPFSVVIDAAAEVADSYLPKKKKEKFINITKNEKKKQGNTHAELAAEVFDALLRRTVSIIWTTPLLIRTSGRTILALIPLDSTTNVPEELVMNCKGSPAAVVAFGAVLFSPNAWITGE